MMAIVAIGTCAENHAAPQVAITVPGAFVRDPAESGGRTSPDGGPGSSEPLDRRGGIRRLGLSIRAPIHKLWRVPLWDARVRQAHRRTLLPCLDAQRTRTPDQPPAHQHMRSRENMRPICLGGTESEWRSQWRFDTGFGRISSYATVPVLKCQGPRNSLLRAPWPRLSMAPRARLELAT